MGRIAENTNLNFNIMEAHELQEGERVFSYGYMDMIPQRIYGTLHKNVDHPDVSEWYITYDDGEDYAVLDISMVYKAN